MAAFLIAEVKLTDDAWVPDYAAQVHGIVHKHGGKYLSRSANVVPVEGEKPDTTVVGIIQFPSLDALRSFVNDPDYAPFAAARKAGSISKLYAIDDTDVAGTLSYLRKG